MSLKDTLEKFKKGDFSFFKFDFSSLSELAKDIKVKLFSDNKVEIHHHYDNSSKTVNFNLSKLSDEEKGHLSGALHSAIEADYSVIEDGARKTIKDLKEEESGSGSSKILEFFKDKVSPQDLEIIRGSLYIRSLFRNGVNIDQLKAEITQKHGQRGKNIVNLCTAGYLEEWLMPIYESIKDTHNDVLEILKAFRKFFNKLVEELPFSIFVCHFMSKENIGLQIRNKMKYGFKFVNIHGIGSSNVKTIRDTVSELEQTGQFKKPITEVDKNNMISVRIEFKE